MLKKYRDDLTKVGANSALSALFRSEKNSRLYDFLSHVLVRRLVGDKNRKSFASRPHLASRKVVNGDDRHPSHN